MSIVFWITLFMFSIFLIFRSWHLEDQLYVARVQAENNRISYQNRLEQASALNDQVRELQTQLNRLRNSSSKPELKKKKKDTVNVSKPHPLEL